MSSEKKKEERYKLEENLEDIVDEILPTELTRRDTIVMFTGFDNKANRKLLGAVHQFSQKPSIKVAYKAKYFLEL